MEFDFLEVRSLPPHDKSAQANAAVLDRCDREHGLCLVPIGRFHDLAGRAVVVGTGHFKSTGVPMPLPDVINLEVPPQVVEEDLLKLRVRGESGAGAHGIRTGGHVQAGDEVAADQPPEVEPPGLHLGVIEDITDEFVPVSLREDQAPRHQN